ncbi:lysozyme [Candidatus Fukatsuia endosymbiont of Tuberolachnus salignus]|uniref:lysozyme n=1 Tax=Candidatus Fukatsuia endosymbiont of Tuberolachnus salignus TaxID=3077957 RepID=UPI00313D6714
MSILSKKIKEMIVTGASASILLTAFLNECEGDKLHAYQDSSGIWTICQGVTTGVYEGMTLTKAQCAIRNKVEAEKALALVEHYIEVPLTEPQKAGVASFCAYNIGIGRCRQSAFFRKLNSGDRQGACAEMKRWIFDGGRDCRIRSNNCYGQIIRRQQEKELCMVD